jgi:hypothetical protein
MFGNLFYIKQKIRSTQFYGIYQLIWGLTLAVIFLTDLKKNKGAAKKNVTQAGSNRHGLIHWGVGPLHPGTRGRGAWPD